MAKHLLPERLSVIEFVNARVDLRERDRLLKGLNVSPVTERALAGLTADEVAQVIRDLSAAPHG
jgi:hypothetical protein